MQLLSMAFQVQDDIRYTVYEAGFPTCSRIHYLMKHKCAEYTFPHTDDFFYIQFLEDFTKYDWSPHTNLELVWDLRDFIKWILVVEVWKYKNLGES